MLDQASILGIHVSYDHPKVLDNVDPFVSVIHRYNNKLNSQIQDSTDRPDDQVSVDLKLFFTIVTSWAFGLYSWLYN